MQRTIITHLAVSMVAVRYFCNPSNMAITLHRYHHQTVADRVDGQTDATNTTLYVREKPKELVRSVRPRSCFHKFASNAAANIFRIDRWCHHRQKFQAVPHR